MAMRRRPLHDRPVAVAAYDRLLRAAIDEARRAPTRLPAAKRGLDIALAGAGLLGSLPLWVAIACLVKLQDGGPVFFRDRRVGRHGREFRVLKFRTMVPDADRLFGPRQAGENDPRVTRIGRILRATAMDELPQLWNIFRGDMSFVGPARAPARRDSRPRGRPGRRARDGARLPRAARGAARG